MARECEQCGSRRFRKDAATGMAVCEEGHVVQGFRAEALVQEMTQHVLQKRTIKKGPRRNKRKERGDRNLDYYHGADADFLRHQAFQIMLRLQVQAVQQLWQVPDVLEAIARDLWAIQLASHPLSAPIKPRNRADSPFEAMANLSVNSPTGSRRGSRRGSPAASESLGSSSGSDSDLEVREDGIDPELLEQLDATDSEDGDEPSREGNEEKRGKSARGKPKKKLAIRAVDTIATVVVALWILRIPVLNVDIQCLIEHCKLPYIDFGHTTYIPDDLKSHLNRDSMLALSPTQAPRPIYLFNACIKLARVAMHTYGVSIPECNASPVIWRCVSILGGTPFTYRQTTRLLAHLDINLSMTVPVKTVVRKLQKEDEDKEEDNIAITERALPVTYRDLVLPELSAVCAMIMIVKIRYGLDGVARLDLDSGIPMPPVRLWMDAIKTHVERGTFAARSALLDTVDFVNMGEVETDALLDQCEEVLLSHHAIVEDPTFPLPPRSTTTGASTEPAHPDWSTLHQQRQVDGPDAKVRAGRNYRSYDAKDYLGKLPVDLEYLVQAAAQVIGVTSQDVLERLQVMERRLQQRRRTLTRRGSQTGMA